MTTKLSFHIFSCSSSDPDHEAAELGNIGEQGEIGGSSKSDGWETQRFCIYPQELIIQFPTTIRLKQMQLLIHQHKIPSKVELYSYLPLTGGDSQDSGFPKFKRLGHFSLNDNEKTHFEARELKSVYIDVYCQYIKLVFHKCYTNKSNIFQQVGLVNLSSLGEIIPTSPMEGPSLQVISRDMKVFEDISQDTMDPYLVERYKELIAQKHTALQEENYDLAKILKPKIDRIKIATTQIAQILIQKQIAVEHEDYDTAKILKHEIEKIRAEALRDEEPSKPTKIYKSPMVYPPTHYDKRETMKEEAEEDNSPRYPMKEYEEEDKEPYSYEEDDEDDELKKGPTKNADDQIVPALRSKPIDFHSVEDPNREEYMQEKEKSVLSLEEFTEENRSYGESLIPYIGKEAAQQFVSKHWQNREKAMIEVNSKVSSILDKGDINSLGIILSICSIAINDRSYQVSLLGLNLYNKVIDISKAKGGLNMKIDNPTIENIHVLTLDKLSEKNQKVKDLGIETYLKVCTMGPFDFNILVNFLTKKSSYVVAKLANSFKHIEGRIFLLVKLYQSLDDMLAQGKTNENTFPFLHITKYLGDHLTNANKNIRNKSRDLFVKIYSRFGYKKVEPAISEMDQEELKTIIKFIPEAEFYMNLEKKKQVAITIDKPAHLNDSLIKDQKSPENKNKAEMGEGKDKKGGGKQPEGTKKTGRK